MSTILITLPDDLAARVAQAARRLRLDPARLARRVVESQLLPAHTAAELDEAVRIAAAEESKAATSPPPRDLGPRSFYERNKDLIEDTEGPEDLATNPAHMEGYGT
jgi:hypothetical protein